MILVIWDLQEWWLKLQWEIWDSQKRYAKIHWLTGANQHQDFTLNVNKLLKSINSLQLALLTLKCLVMHFLIVIHQTMQNTITLTCKILIRLLLRNAKVKQYVQLMFQKNIILYQRLLQGKLFLYRCLVSRQSSKYSRNLK